MSYSPLLSEMDQEALITELHNRWRNQASGLCDWCEEPRGSEPPCRFPGRHDGHRGDPHEAVWAALVMDEGRAERMNDDLEKVRAEHMAAYKRDTSLPDWYRVVHSTGNRYIVALEAEVAKHEVLTFQLRNIFQTDDPTEIRLRVEYLERQWMKALGEA